MSKAAWYWHRLRAMSLGEMLLHARKRWRQKTDARPQDWPDLTLDPTGAFPHLPKREDAPVALREALRRDADEILAGRWRAFGHLELKVDDPPKWHCDYLVGRDFATQESAFTLDHRALPGGADIKLIWELSRWAHLTRLAMAAYVLGDQRAAEKCLAWLEDWVKCNPPYRGWNWTSALESGLRLIQFTWIDALLSAVIVSDFGFGVSGLKSALREGVDSPSPQPSPPGEGEDCAASGVIGGVSPSRAGRGELPLPGEEGRGEGEPSSITCLSERLAQLRREILPPHVWFTWRHRSFGSSANNHLLGELAGLITATVRWPELNRLCAPLDGLQDRWAREVLNQFAEDGGNKEQALNYHLFSWELCWQTQRALTGAGLSILPGVDSRLRQAARFFVDVQVPSDPWDYGDSDNAVVTPFALDENHAVAEWHGWLRGQESSPALDYWLGEAQWDLKSEISDFKSAGWRHFERSGYAIWRDTGWALRWDLSPLGMGSMAAHGHLDALHLSLWCRGVAMVIDPGTGAYYADKSLRNWLTGRSAHNIPTPDGEDWPQRLGSFLWAENHEAPLVNGGVSCASSNTWGAELFTKALSLHRSVKLSEDGLAWEVEDSVACLRDDWADAARDFSVRWQFAPESSVEILGERQFRIIRHGVAMEVQVSADWAEVFCVTDQTQVAEADPDAPLAGIVSPAFRKTVWAPYLKLMARPTAQPCVFSTRFLACGPSIPADRA